MLESENVSWLLKKKNLIKKCNDHQLIFFLTNPLFID